MSFDISALEPQVRDILSAPGTDLQTISAKRVRKMLLELEPSLTEEVLKKHKAELDTVIATVFQSVSAEAGMVENSEEPKRKRDGRTVKEEADEDDDDAPSPPPKKARKATKKELSDAELARQLSSEINGRTRRSGTGNGSVAKKGNRKVKKSADFIDTDDSDDEGGAKKKRKSGTKGGRAKGGFAKEYLLR
jgi:upstream activation factor subunit UAF30